MTIPEPRGAPAPFSSYLLFQKEPRNCFHRATRLTLECPDPAHEVLCKGIWGPPNGLSTSHRERPAVAGLLVRTHLCSWTGLCPGSCGLCFWYGVLSFLSFRLAMDCKPFESYSSAHSGFCVFVAGGRRPTSAQAAMLPEREVADALPAVSLAPRKHDGDVARGWGFSCHRCGTEALRSQWTFY